MKEKVKIESGMRAEIHTADGKIHSGTISNIVEEPEVTPYAFSWEEVQEKGWEARKWEVAVAVMQRLLARKETLDSWAVEDIADYSFSLADALVKEFKKDRKNGKVE